MIYQYIYIYHDKIISPESPGPKVDQHHDKMRIHHDILQGEAPQLCLSVS